MKKIIAVEEEEKGSCFRCDGGGCHTKSNPAIRAFNLPDCDTAPVIYKEVEDYTMLTTNDSLASTSFVFNDSTHNYAGELYWENNKLKFKGDIHETAKALFKEVSKIFSTI